MIPNQYGKTFNLLKKSTKTYWHDYTHHKFVQKLALGTLNKKLFINYLIQDYIFLIHFSRAWALLIVKSNSLNEMKLAANTVNTLVNEEIQLHVKTCLKEGISEKQLYHAEEKINNLSYTRFVLEAGYTGGYLDLLVSLSPCIFGYGEIGQRLIKESKPRNKYKDWIDVYSGKDYQRLCIKIGEMLDASINNRLGKNYENHKSWPDLEKKFLLATKLEINFWEMSLKK